MFSITAAFLAVVFVAAEFYRFRRRITGSIREILFMDGDPTGIAGVRLRVETSEAGEVTAFMSGCQRCLSPVATGDAVSLIPGPNGYIVKSSWISPKRRGIPCAMTAKTSASPILNVCADGSQEPSLKFAPFSDGPGDPSAQIERGKD